MLKQRDFLEQKGHYSTLLIKKNSFFSFFFEFSVAICRIEK